MAEVHSKLVLDITTNATAAFQQTTQGAGQAAVAVQGLERQLELLAKIEQNSTAAHNRAVQDRIEGYRREEQAIIQRNAAAAGASANARSARFRQVLGGAARGGAALAGLAVAGGSLAGDDDGWLATGGRVGQSTLQWTAQGAGIGAGIGAFGGAPGAAIGAGIGSGTGAVIGLIKGIAEEVKASRAKDRDKAEQAAEDQLEAARTQLEAASVARDASRSQEKAIAHLEELRAGASDPATIAAINETLSFVRAQGYAPEGGWRAALIKQEESAAASRDLTLSIKELTARFGESKRIRALAPSTGETLATFESSAFGD